MWLHDWQVRVDCDRLDADASDVFGRGRRRGLLYWLGDGALLLNNLNEARAALHAAFTFCTVCTNLPSSYQDGACVFRRRRSRG